MKSHYYARNSGDLKQRLKESLDRDRLRELHQVRPHRHFVTAGRLVLMTLLCGAALWQTRWPWLWLPAVLCQGFNLLGFIILLHEQVHDCIFRGRRPRLDRWLGFAYGLPAGLSASQFKIWHLDHHNELGSETDDPKRAHLSPKRNRRWVKLLYLTPALFFIYARASRTEAAAYPEESRRRIRAERIAVGLAHVVLFVGIGLGGGWDTAFRVHLVPMFAAFPLAFLVNRLGQHYNVDRNNPAHWSSRVDGNPVWHFLFLWSNFHIEHHYYPRVPFYNLRQLNQELRPFFRENQIPNRTYREILWGWFVHNRPAHTHWDHPDDATERDRPVTTVR